MLIGVQKRFVFIANSKTASTSIESALTPYAEINRVGSPQRKHIAWHEVRKEYSFLFDQPDYSPSTFFKFGVVREPADWIRSWFNYRSGNLEIESPLPSDISFEDFWRRDDWVKGVNQKSKFLDENGKFSFDVILPQDDLKALFPIVSSILGIDVNLPTENKSPKRLTKEHIAKELLSEINNYYLEDYEFYLDWKNRCRNVLENIAAPHQRRYQLSPTYACKDNVLIPFAAIDVTTKEILLGQSGIIGGLVVLAKEAPEGCFLRLINMRNGSDVGTPTWGIHSPVVAEKYPYAMNSSNARFKIEGVGIQPGETYRLGLFKDGLELAVLFDICLTEKDDQ